MIRSASRPIVRIVVVALLAATAACSGGDGEGGSSPTTEADEVTTTTAGTDAEGRPLRLGAPAEGIYRERLEETGKEPEERTVEIAIDGATPGGATLMVTRPAESKQIVFRPDGVTEMRLNGFQAACDRPIPVVAFPLTVDGTWEVDSRCTIPTEEVMVNLRVSGTAKALGWATATTGDGQAHDVWKVSFDGTFDYGATGTAGVRTTVAYTETGLPIEEVAEISGPGDTPARTVVHRFLSTSPG